MGAVAKNKVKEFYLDTGDYDQGDPDDGNGTFARVKTI